MRGSGLDVKWSKTKAGAPIIVGRWPNAPLKHQREKWYYIDAEMFRNMQKTSILEAFDSRTMLANYFSI